MYMSSSKGSNEFMELTLKPQGKSSILYRSSCDIFAKRPALQYGWVQEPSFQTRMPETAKLDICRRHKPFANIDCSPAVFIVA